MTRKIPARSYHHGDLRSTIKKAALKLVRSKGSRGFSLNEASRLAGVTAAAPYRHFTDKETLLAEIICDGNAILEKETRKAAAAASGIKEQILEAGMAYLQFSETHSDYFAVIFNSGVDKAKFPEVQRSAKEAFGVILSLTQQLDPNPESARERAVLAWALVHGLATLCTDNALPEAAGRQKALESFRPILRRFLDHL